MKRVFAILAMVFMVALFTACKDSSLESPSYSSSSNGGSEITSSSNEEESDVDSSDDEEENGEDEKSEVVDGITGGGNFNAGGDYNSNNK